MARSSLLWIESDEIEGLLSDLRRPAGSPRRASSTVQVTSASSVAPAASSTGPSTTGPSTGAPASGASSPAAGGVRPALPSGLEWPDVEGLSRADFDRAGARLIEKLLEDPSVVTAFVADSDGLLLLGDEDDLALPVVAAELTGRWHALRGQLEIGKEPGVVSVRLGEERVLEAVGVATGSRHLRILAWMLAR